MDLLDRRLIDAWRRVMARCESDPDEARRRWRRVTETRTVNSVPSAWTLKLRANDTRLDRTWGVETDRDAVDRREPHTLTISGDAIRELCAPVRLDWPGMTLNDAAKRLGRHREALRHWLPVKQGRSKSQKQANRVRVWEHYRTARCRPRSGALPSASSEPGCVSPTTPADPQQPLIPPHPANTPRVVADKPGLHVRYEKASSHGKRGNAVPIVWADRPIDPGAARGDGPHPLWGSAWQHFSEHIPPEYELQARRVPRIRPRRGKPEFRGWEWLCPGHPTPVGGWHDCGQRCLVLYGPLPIMSVGRWLNDTRGLPVSPALQGLWHPAQHDPLEDTRAFACASCWNIQGTHFTNYRGWNDFITHLSNGLLFGRDVDHCGIIAFTTPRPRHSELGRVGPASRGDLQPTVKLAG